MAPAAAALVETTRPSFGPHAKLRGEMSANVQPAWLRDAVYDTIHGERGRAKVIADALPASYNHVTALANPSERVVLKAHEIPALTLSTGCYAILDALEAAVGRVAFRLHTGSPALDQIHRKLSDSVKQFGEFLQVTGDAIEDGRLESAEAHDVLKEIDELIAALCECRARVVAQAKADAEREPQP